jgi:nuclear pore complex protein Nup133
LIAAENVGGLPLFFSRIHGVICVSPSDFEPDFFNNSMNVSISNANLSTMGGAGDIFSPQQSAQISMMETSVLSPNTTNAGNLSVYALDPEEIRENNRDVGSQFKAAFIYHLKRNAAMCQTILNELFGNSIDGGYHTDSELDKTALMIARGLAEDIPASDPRWEVEMMNQSSTVALGSSTSMQIIQQLREKNFCMIKFSEFLHAVGLWGKFTAVTEKGSVKSTASILSDINEKLVAAITIKCLHQPHARIIDEAIEMVFSDQNILALGNLTNQDIFYTKISQIQELFKKFTAIIENLVRDEAPNHQLQNTIIEVNTIILQVLQEVIKFREKNAGLYKPYNIETFDYEYLPWTAASDEGGLRDTLLQMIQLTLQQGIRLNGETEYRFKHYQQMTELIDYVLDGRRNFLTSIRNNPEKLNILHHQYESQRFDLIYPLVEEEQFELAAKLAEKYLDFQTLVIICDKTENQQRLDEYIERFKTQNFSQFAISWHMKQNRQGN